MKFVWLGFLKEGEEIDPALQREVSDFVGQPLIPISTLGVLRHKAGDRAGYLMIFDAESREAAEALAEASPVRKAGLYSEFHLFEFQSEVG